MIVYGFDPGGTTGFFKGEITDEKKLVPLWAEEMSYQDVLNWCIKLMNTPPEPGTIIIAEDYIIDPKGQQYSHQGDKGITMRLLGALELTALKVTCEFVLQPNWRKPAGYGFAGQTYVRGKKGQHIQDAFAHVVYYGVMQNILDPLAPRKLPESPSPKPKIRRTFRTQSGSQWRRPNTPSE